MSNWIEVGQINDIPKLGARVVQTPQGDIAVFRNSRKDTSNGSLSAGEVIEKFFIKDEKIIINVLINMMMFSATMMDEENKDIFNKL